MLENMILVDINDKYKKDYKKLNNDLVNQYIKRIEIFDKNRVKVIYKSDK